MEQQSRAMQHRALVTRRAVRAGMMGMAAVALTATPGTGVAQAFTDPAGDFRPGYVASGGAMNAGLDVTGGAVYFNGTSFIFTATLAGTVDPAIAPASWAYVWGVNRGAGTARFAALGLNDILFDAVVIARPNGPDVVNRLTPAASSTTLSGTATTFSGNSFTVIVPATLLPTQGFALTDYTFNLWPRVTGSAPNPLPAGVVNASDAEIVDFAPNAVNVGVAAVVPEPATALLLAPALAGLALVRRRRSR